MTEGQRASKAKTRLDGDDLRAMFSCATRLFEKNVEAINALNVFPVPDGDTGINMFLTLGDVVKEAEGAQSASAGEIASAMARGALMGARGNSGVILSQFFKGIALELGDKPDCGVPDLAAAFQSAREHAYKAVGEPVEGTLLTVISSVAKAARERSDAGDTVQEFFDAVCDAARESVALTPTMLPVLRDAGVVDAGGHGLSVILEGIRLYLRGEEGAIKQMPPPAPVGVEVGAGTVSREFLEATEEELYGYCTQFLIQGQDLDPEAVREKMASLAHSTVVVGDDSMVKVHVHADDPGAIISYAVSLGSLSQVKMDNMDEQHREYSVARRQDSGAVPVQTSAASIAVVAVAWGQGLETVLADLGAAYVMPAGDTMNPSVQEILDAVEGVPSDTVIFLPNNPNIVAAAEQAVDLCKKRLRVVQATTIPQGIEALLAFNPEKDLDENLAEMGRTLAAVRTGEVCQAARPVVLNGVSVREGQIIGLLERELVAAGDEPTEVLVSLVRAAEVAEGDLVTLYWGQRLTQQDADAARQRLEDAVPGAEVEIVPGGQPHYHYILSIE